MRALVASALLSLVVGSGCATNLVVSQTAADAAALPGGIPVNRRIGFRVSSFTTKPNAPLLCAGNTATCVPKLDQRHDGVDPNNLLFIDISRQAFASGTISLTLDEMQRIQDLTITSTSGAADGITSASEVIGAVAPKKDAAAK
jgi:hypothetical protein